MSHAPQVAAALTPGGDYDYTATFRHLGSIFRAPDTDRFGRPAPPTVAIANLETTLRAAPPYTGYPSFAAPAALATAMRRAGIEIVTTANNHICDKGAAGIRATLALLDSAGIRHTGAFLDSADYRARNPLRFTAGGVRCALLAYTYGTNGLPVPRGMIVNLIDTAAIARDLAAARAVPTDVVIVACHWGEEYRITPSPLQRSLAAWIRARGADIIIGHHPHVVQPAEVYLDADSTAVVGATYYSLGNFVSNQRARRTDGGIAAEITVTRSDTLPPRFDFGWRPLWVYTPLRGGVRRYEVLPLAAPAAIYNPGGTIDYPAAIYNLADSSSPGVLDTLPEPARTLARQFLTDTRALLPLAKKEGR
jgi:poly-gamma-glutamate synthesis protein (capsule biosynthesis protein)